jgi:hypothetical protein
MSASYELQKAIYTALTSDTELMADITGVFDSVPDNYDQFPYVTIGEDVLTEFDTDSTNGFNGSITIHAWSRYDGRKEAKTIQGLIYDTLHKSTLPMTGYAMILMRQESENTLLDPDGVTRHGVQTFNTMFIKTV